MYTAFKDLNRDVRVKSLLPLVSEERQPWVVEVELNSQIRHLLEPGFRHEFPGSLNVVRDRNRLVPPFDDVTGDQRTSSSVYAAQRSDGFTIYRHRKSSPHARVFCCFMSAPHQLQITARVSLDIHPGLFKILPCIEDGGARNCGVKLAGTKRCHCRSSIEPQSEVDRLDTNIVVIPIRLVGDHSKLSRRFPYIGNVCAVPHPIFRFHPSSLVLLDASRMHYDH